MAHRAKLTVVELPTTAPPPRAFGAKGQALWDTLSPDVDDALAAEILRQACAGADRAEELAAQISRDGPMISNPRTGVRKPHPLLAHESAARALVCRLLSRLKPARRPGRPPSGFGVTCEQLLAETE